MEPPLQRQRRRREGRVPDGGRVNAVEDVQNLLAVPGPADPGGLSVTRVHPQRERFHGGSGVGSGYTQAQRGAQVEQASTGHPLPALEGLLTV